MSGSRDCTVGIWELDSAGMVQQLKGHQYQVAAVGVAPDGRVVSASLDKSARIWKDGTCTATLEGHEGAVLCLAVLPESSLLATGSGDGTIKIWSLDDYSCIRTVPAHKDSVRCLATLPGAFGSLISASHDTTLKIWNPSGECVAELVGHTALVYSVAVSTDIVASGSEDNTAKVWAFDGTCLQSLEHPGCVWATAFLPNGDLVTACSDGVARIWSQDPGRRADAKITEELAAAVASRKQELEKSKSSSHGNGEGGVSLPSGLDLRDPLVLAAPGSRDGQTVIVKEGSSGVAYSWDAAKSEWERIGEVVSGPDEGTGIGKKCHQGREWDHVFDVDVADGAPQLKLAMDAGENPYLVAERFIQAHELPMEYKEQIVQFIIQNTGNAGPVPSGNYVDPFTGGSAYVPPPISTAPGTAGVAPSSDYMVTGGGADPFTGVARPTSAPQRHLPAKKYLVFDSPPPADGLRKKLSEFSAILSSDPSTAQIALKGSEVEEGGALEALLSTAFRSGAADGTTLSSPAVLSLLKRLLGWPPAQLYPSLDIARMMALTMPGGSALAALSDHHVAVHAPLGSLGHALAVALGADPPIPATQQVALRLVANCFSNEILRNWIRKDMAAILELVSRCATSGQKGVRLGVATVLVNFSVFLNSLPGDELEGKKQVVFAAASLLQACPSDDEIGRYNALIAIGTAASEHSHIRAVSRTAGLLSLATSIEQLEGKVGEVAAELAALLRY